MASVLFVVTTHEKYVNNGMIDRCIKSIKEHFVNPDILVECDELIPGLIFTYDEVKAIESNNHLGVTQARLAGYVYAREHKYDWVTFVDADAYFTIGPNVAKFLECLENPDLDFISIRYGFHKPNGTDFIVDTYPEGEYSKIDTCERIFSLGEDRDYPIFMGRFLRVNKIKADMFVDTKMIGDDGIFFFMYLSNYNLKGKCYKLGGIVLTDEEENKALDLFNIDVGTTLLRWTINNIRVSDEFQPALSGFIFKHLIMGKLAYTYHRNKEITEEDLFNVIRCIPNKFNEGFLSKEQNEFLDLVRTSSVAVTKFFEARYK